MLMSKNTHCSPDQLKCSYERNGQGFGRWIQNKKPPENRRKLLKGRKCFPLGTFATTHSAEIRFHVGAVRKSPAVRYDRQRHLWLGILRTALVLLGLATH